jgi:hypothetical protein
VSKKPSPRPGYAPRVRDRPSVPAFGLILLPRDRGVPRVIGKPLMPSKNRIAIV